MARFLLQLGCPTTLALFLVLAVYEFGNPPNKILYLGGLNLPHGSCQALPNFLFKTITHRLTIRTNFLRHGG